MRTAPLRRNRDFVLLQVGQLLSSAGTEMTTIAYPLLVLATSHSPAQAGLVTFARLAPFAIFGLVSGVVADCWNRKHVMIAADATRAVALGGLASAMLLGNADLSLIVVVAFVEGAGSTFFATAQNAALRAVVPLQQLPDAAGAQEARRAAVRLGGSPLGGALFGIGRSLPFLADTASTCARRFRCSRCAHRSRNRLTPSSRRCARGSPKASDSCGASPFSARARFSMASEISSFPACCWLSSSWPGARVFLPARSAC